MILTSRNVTDPDHLPECKGSTEPYGDPRLHYCCPECDPGVTPPWEQDCICDRLRACEERVMSQFVDGIELVSYRRGLDAAREAVESRWTLDPSWDGTNWNNALHEAVAAIDSLRGAEARDGHIRTDIGTRP